MALLSQAMKRPAEERQEFVCVQCDMDQKLHEEVLEALYWEERMGSFLKEPLLELATLLLPFEPGEDVADRFTIVGEIGEGGMGVVYEALDRKRKQRIAIKAAKPGFQRLLSPELEGALKVRHHNICLVNEIHTAQTQHGPIDFLSMELVKGQTLSAHLRTVGKFGHEEALDISCQLCAGLAEAHDSGVLHRDLKSSNILLCQNDDGTCRAVITDFGLASCKDLESAESGGTPGYMAPELWDGEKATTASDIYALGVILYEMVTGLRPDESRQLECNTESLSTVNPQPGVANEEHERPSLMSISESDWNGIATADLIRRPSKWTKGLDPRWDRVILRCLATVPAQRPQDAHEVLAELKREPIPKWPFATVGVLFLLLTTVFAFVRPARQWAEDLIWPPNVRLAILPFEGPPDLGAVGDGTLQDVADRVQQLSSGRRAVAVIPAARLSDMHVQTSQQARDVIHATHALKLTAQRNSSGQTTAHAAIIDLSSQLPVRALSATYSQPEMQSAARALTGLVAVAFRLSEPSSGKEISVAANGPYLKGLYFLNRDSRSYDSAMEQFREAARLDPDSPLPTAGLSLALVQKFDFTKQKSYLEQAQVFMHTAQSRNPDSVKVLLAAGQVSEKMSQYLEALQCYRRVQELEPRSVDAWLGLASTYDALHEQDQSVQAYRKAQELDPEYYKPYQLLGAFYERHGRHSEAAEQFRQMIARAPGLPDSYFGLGSALTELGRYDEAEDALQTSLRIRETAEGLNNLGAIRYFQGRHEEAAAYQKRALTYGPNNYLWLMNIADNLRLAGHQKEALFYYQRTKEEARLEITSNPQSARGRAYFAYACARLGDKQRAMDEIRQAMNLQPGENQVLDWALEIYELLKERELAIDAFRGLTLDMSKELTHDPDLLDFFQDSRVKQLMIDKGGQ